MKLIRVLLISLSIISFSGLLYTYFTLLRSEQRNNYLENELRNKNIVFLQIIDLAKSISKENLTSLMDTFYYNYISEYDTLEGTSPLVLEMKNAYKYNSQINFLSLSNQIHYFHPTLFKDKFNKKLYFGASFAFNENLATIDVTINHQKFDFTYNNLYIIPKSDSIHIEMEYKYLNSQKIKIDTIRFERDIVI